MTPLFLIQYVCPVFSFFNQCTDLLHVFLRFSVLCLVNYNIIIIIPCVLKPLDNDSEFVKNILQTQKPQK